MAIHDIFKKKKQGIKKEAEKKQKKEIVPETQKEKERFENAYRVLKLPHITEKATFLTGKNQYTFKVFPKANKTEIKKIVKNLYKVDVLDVNTAKIPKKRMRLGRISGWKKGYKKAIVKIKEGQKIEVLPR